MANISIIGAGFSGLVSGYFASRAGHRVQIYESGSEPGGMIQTYFLGDHLIESAANGLLNSKLVEDVFEDLNLNLIGTMKQSRARYIYKDRPRRWPVGFFETSYRLPKILMNMTFNRKKWKPKSGESLSQWSERTIGPQFLNDLLAPALNGIYAGDPQELSASLVLGPIFSNEKSEKPKVKGTVTPAKGMGDFIEKMKSYILKSGGGIKYDCSSLDLLSMSRPLILCGNVHFFKKAILELGAPGAELWQKVREIPLVSTTLIFNRNEAKNINGFGCLFPREEKFNSLGVLFNHNIFPGRSHLQSETWISGGALNEQMAQCSEEQILQLTLEDRKKLLLLEESPMLKKTHIWKRAIPHYNVDLERALNSSKLPLGVYAVGNYKGKIGLAKIMKDAQETVVRIGENH